MKVEEEEGEYEEEERKGSEGIGVKLGEERGREEKGS